MRGRTVEMGVCLAGADGCPCRREMWVGCWDKRVSWCACSGTRHKLLSRFNADLASSELAYLSHRMFSNIFEGGAVSLIL